MSEATKDGVVIVIMHCKIHVRKMIHVFRNVQKHVWVQKKKTPSHSELETDFTVFRKLI